MEIKCNINKNYFKCFNEVQGVEAKKNRIFKNSKTKSRGYLEQGILNLIIVFILYSIRWILYYLNKDNQYTKILDLIFLILIIILAIYFLYFYVSFSKNKNKNHDINLKFDKTGITDLSDSGIAITVSWNKIKCIVIKKYTITILTEYPVIFFMAIDKKDEIIREVNKYNSEIKIHEKSKKKLTKKNKK